MGSLWVWGASVLVPGPLKGAARSHPGSHCPEVNAVRCGVASEFEKTSALLEHNQYNHSIPTPSSSLEPHRVSFIKDAVRVKCGNDSMLVQCRNNDIWLLKTTNDKINNNPQNPDLENTHPLRNEVGKGVYKCSTLVITDVAVSQWQSSPLGEGIVLQEGEVKYLRINPETSELVVLD